MQVAGPGPIPGIDAHLVAADLVETGSITGRVTDADGLPVEGAWVMAYRSTDRWVGSTWAFTAPDGSYRLDGVRAETHLIYVIAPVGSGLRSRWFDGAAVRSLATPVGVEPGGDTGGIDVELDLADPGDTGGIDVELDLDDPGDTEDVELDLDDPEDDDLG